VQTSVSNGKKILAEASLCASKRFHASAGFEAIGKQPGLPQFGQAVQRGLKLVLLLLAVLQIALGFGDNFGRAEAREFWVVQNVLSARRSLA